MVVSTAITIGAAIAGAVSGWLGHSINTYNNYNYYDDLVDDLKEQKKLALADLQLDYKNARKEAVKNIERSEKRSNLQEGYIGEDINESIEGLTLSQLGEGLSYNMAAQEIGKSKGDALTNAAASGTRAGGSMSKAIELEAAMNSQQLQANEDMKRQSDDLQLRNVLKNLQGNMLGLQENRTDARDLLLSYLPGGYNSEKYKNAKQKTENAYDQSLKEARTQRDSNAIWNPQWWLNGFTQSLNMGSSAMNMANSISTTYKDLKKPDYGTNTTANNTPTLNNFGNSSGTLTKRYSFNYLG